MGFKYGLNFNFLSKFVQKCYSLKKNNDHAVPGSFFSQDNLVDKVHILGEEKNSHPSVNIFVFENWSEGVSE